MTDGGADRRDQLAMWAMAEATRLRRLAKHAGGKTAGSESPRGASQAGRGGDALPSRAADRGGLVVDWQMPEGLSPDTAAYT